MNKSDSGPSLYSSAISVNFINGYTNCYLKGHINSYFNSYFNSYINRRLRTAVYPYVESGVAA